VVLLEHDRLLGELVNVRGGRPRVAIASEVVRPGGVEHDYDQVGVPAGSGDGACSAPDSNGEQGAGKKTERAKDNRPAFHESVISRRRM
jgi:hypothetical protein